MVPGLGPHRARRHRIENAHSRLTPEGSYDVLRSFGVPRHIYDLTALPVWRLGGRCRFRVLLRRGGGSLIESRSSEGPRTMHSACEGVSCQTRDLSRPVAEPDRSFPPVPGRPFLPGTVRSKQGTPRGQMGKRAGLDQCPIRQPHEAGQSTTLDHETQIPHRWANGFLPKDLFGLKGSWV